mgnify:CR=1 FL=1
MNNPSKKHDILWIIMAKSIFYPIYCVIHDVISQKMRIFAMSFRI